MGMDAAGTVRWPFAAPWRCGVSRRLIEEQKRRLVPGESVLIHEGRIETLHLPHALLTDSAGTPPAIFVLHPRPEGFGQEDWSPVGTALGPAQRAEHALRLAAEHRVDPGPRRAVMLIERLERDRRWVELACTDLAAAARLKRSMPPSAEWLLDNEYIFESSAHDVRVNLPPRFYRQLPVLGAGRDQGLPRIYVLARELAAHTEMRLDQENILGFLEAYQSAAPLTIGELWAVPQMLRFVSLENIRQLARLALSDLREGELADLWANRLVRAYRCDSKRFFSVMAELTAARPRPNLQFASQLMDYLYDEGPRDPVRTWLEGVVDTSLEELKLREKNRQAHEHRSIANSFNSLRDLARLDWKDCFESLSVVERTLRQDPAGIYPRMDFATRDRYRRAIEDLRRGSGLAEAEVAACAVAKAGRAGHVGRYLIGEERGALAHDLDCRETLRFRTLRWAYRHPSAVYFSALVLFTTAFLVLALRSALEGDAPLMYFFAALALLVPGSQSAVDVANFLVVGLMPPRTLPKMDFRKSGIPDACRTLVVVPMLLVDARTVRDEAEKLELRYLANKERNLLFCLYSDHVDAAQERSPGDADLLRAAQERVRSLNRKYRGDRFFLLHRERRWSESEQKFIGWERKRGKLEELNALIVGARPPDAGRLVHVGDADRLAAVRYVIVLDSDTLLPHDTARRLVETLAHPLNRAVFDAAGRVASGYSVIQPRVSPSFPSASGSRFSRLFSDPVGIDPYTHAVSDVYQDLAGEGSYYGKGIYDVRAFHRNISGRFPQERLLSHDLIEGAHVRVGLASDIELFDEFPQDYHTYFRRRHRWVRGDWQIAEWVFPRVPLAEGGRGPNPLSLFDRWKILDNLRRSLLPGANLLLLVASWGVSSRAACTAAAIVAAQLFFHSLVQPFAWVMSGPRWRGLSLTHKGHDLMRMLVEAALLPYDAWVGVDAMVRVGYRRMVSGRGLLEWTSAQSSQAAAQSHARGFLASLGLVTLLSALLAGAVAWFDPAVLPWAGPWLALWALAPLIGWVLVRRPRPRPPRLAERERLFLRKLARRTWRYFSDFVTQDTSWLPPDNYQVAYCDELALRTSPTNIGLYLLSVVGAHDQGYLTTDEALEKLTLTMGTLDKLERHEGHLLNWYDIKTLAPLDPRYVSMVDSGNLLGALWAWEPGVQSLARRPLLGGEAFAGLRDTGEVLREVLHEDKSSAAALGRLDEMLEAWREAPPRLVDALSLLRAAAPRVEDIAAGTTEAAYWAGQVRDRLAAWTHIADRYLDWVEVLAERPEAEIAGLMPTGVPALRRALARAPSLVELAQGENACIAMLKSLRERIAGDAVDLHDWIDRVLLAFSKAKWLAGEMLARHGALIASGRALSASLDMGFLYNAERRLFSVGFNVSEGRLDHAFYDLLASEARLGSFVAIARGDVPAEHWFAMNRPYGAVNRRRALLSWTGTMFEYLMPLLLQRSYGGSLLDKSAKEAVEIQIAFGRAHGLPWGMSESAYADIDRDQIYQYQAFGVPKLGLKRGLAEKIVVAPYATLLALGIAPLESVRNLKRLADLGLLAGYGFYEAVDFSQPRAEDGGRGQIVRAYMAHHQGMGFLALTNFLHDDILPRRFHADLRVRAVESLLQERIPLLPTLHHDFTRERVASVAETGEEALSISQFDTPHTATPKTQLLSNGRYGLMLTNAGGGYSRWGDFDITRWRSDPTRDPWGTFCLFYEADGDRLWSAAYQPTGGGVDDYSANFTLDRAVIRRVEHGIESAMEVVVSPEDDVEIRRVTLCNRSERTRRIELTSYVELALAAHAADRQHPAFNKMFIETEALIGRRALLARRRLRGADDPAICVGHRLTLERLSGEDMRFETDRRRFIGRGRTVARPRGAVEEPSCTQGYVLDPILSLRESLVLEPGEHIQVSMVLAAAGTREQVVAWMDKYADARTLDRTMDLAWAAAQLELRLLRIMPDEARHYQKIASHLLYPNRLLRPPPGRIAENRKGQSALWAYGISGDLPIALVSITESRDIGTVREMLQAHAYWRMHGLGVDLVILDEEAVGYEQPLKERLEHLIQTQGSTTRGRRPGRVFLRSAALIPQQDRTLLRAAAAVVIVAARGALSQQLGAAAEPPAEGVLRTVENAPRDASAALRFLELPYFNGLGGFTSDGREYAVYLGPDTHTPAPWINVIANPGFGALVSETGAGSTWQGNSQRNRLSAWSNDAVTDPASEAIYIRDDESGAYWTPTAAPIRERGAYRARHGAGYSAFEHNSHGIEAELTVFVPVDDAGGEPVKLQRLTLVNGTERTRKLSVTYFVEWTLGESRETTHMHVVTGWDEPAQALLGRNPANEVYAGHVAFVALSRRAHSFSADRTAFLGRNGSLERPAALGRTRLSRRTGAGLDPCAAVQTVIELAPGERIELTCMLGQGADLGQVRDLVGRYRDARIVESALRATQAWWDDRLGTIVVRTPELTADFMINRWLQYQNLVCRVWGRSAFYQSGGAFGFRDQLQDVMALLYCFPGAAREHILRAAGRQFKEGDVQHWWHPPHGEGIRSRISDDLLWLPFVVAQYVRVTGDADILNENVPFLEAPVLDDAEAEKYQTPGPASEQATLFEHCRRALERGQKFGVHGLPLMGTGDWNDGMNLVGAGGKGESVWLAWFLAEVLRGMAELSEALGRTDLRDGYRNDRDALMRNAEAGAWDGAWYLRAFFDDGTPLGASSNREARIDSLAQSWACLSGADPERAAQAVESAWEHLVRDDEGLVLLLEPPVDRMDPSPGYLKSYPPGVRENGGQYTHAAVWLAMALARRGDGTRATKILRLLNPILRTLDPEAVARYAVEPYAVAADVYRLPGKIGRGGWTWYTGSAAWMYRAWVEEILGLKVRAETLRIDPVIPGWWDGFEMRLRHGEAVYQIQVENPEHRERGVARVELDGRLIEGGVITLERESIRHRVVVRMGGAR